MKKILKMSGLMLGTCLMPLVAQAQMQPVSYEDLSRIAGQALTLPTGKNVSVDIGQSHTKGLSFSMDPTGSGSFSVGPTNAKIRNVSYQNTVTGAGAIYDGGRSKSHGFTFTWTAPGP